MRNSQRLAYVAAMLIAGFAPLFASAPTTQPTIEGFPGWPTHFEGRKLTPLELSSAEVRFERDFPGRLGRFTDGEREIVIRWVSQATRKLHPSADCFRGSGYRVTPMSIEMIDGKAWSRFDAQHKTGLHAGFPGNSSLVTGHWRVREIIIDEAGGQWTDVSSWYWAAMRDRTEGHWWSMTVASPATSTATSTRAQFTTVQ